jgi:hypothetical protein
MKHLLSQRTKFRASNKYYEKSGQLDMVLSFRDWLDLPF